MSNDDHVSNKYPISYLIYVTLVILNGVTCWGYWIYMTPLDVFLVMLGITLVSLAIIGLFHLYWWIRDH